MASSSASRRRFTRARARMPGLRPSGRWAASPLPATERSQKQSDSCSHRERLDAGRTLVDRRCCRGAPRCCTAAGSGVATQFPPPHPHARGCSGHRDAAVGWAAVPRHVDRRAAPGKRWPSTGTPPVEGAGWSCWLLLGALSAGRQRRQRRSQQQQSASSCSDRRSLTRCSLLTVPRLSRVRRAGTRATASGGAPRRRACP